MIRIRSDGVLTNYGDVQVLSGPESTTATCFWSYLHVHMSVVCSRAGRSQINGFQSSRSPTCTSQVEPTAAATTTPEIRRYAEYFGGYAELLNYLAIEWSGY